MSPRLIAESQELADFIAALEGDAYVAVDTEFIRERTYWPRLCLAQLAGEREAAAIDALAPGLDLAPLYAFLRRPETLKVFHAGLQDIEIFFLRMQETPRPLYDTQVAAMALGYGEQVGYEALVRQLLARELDKSQRFTDWGQRPLTQAQLDYALGDVIYLRGAYEKLRAEIAALGREAWVAEELERLGDPALYVMAPEDAWKKLRRKDTKPAYLARLRALAAWREKQARSEDRPRGWILNDDALQEIALANPASVAALRKGRMIGKHLASLNLEALLEVVEEANRLPAEERPRAERRPPPSAEAEAQADMLKALLRAVCREQRISPGLVANAEEIAALAAGERPFRPLNGWRNEVFGAKARLLLEGKIALRYDPPTRGVAWLPMP